MLHWSRVRAGRSEGDLADGRADDVLLSQSELSVRAHVIFSCEGRMKVAETFVHERNMLSLCTASYLA